ncbi:glycoside hydrolase family 36 protein [Paenibacillus sp. P46E]|uniref:glycoside hydrolase family 36 protein n=1 Tax=Paenibacillus sp. P46E TaxID=1349436 RepID=UPI00093EEDA9|nr:glycoside hydrolase family 36 protein [Paenibacillus sp. P46E]OKP94971.1 glycoside hydrolase [Paenibacillus sp. P46E]
MKIILSNGCEMRLEGQTGTFALALSSFMDVAEADVEYVRLIMDASSPAVLPELSLKWSCAAVDVQGLWHPTVERSRGLIPDWRQGFPSRSTSSAPVICLYGNRGNNVLTFACSDVLSPVELHAGLNEETSSFHCSVTLFADPGAPEDHVEVMLRLDTRSHPYYDALKRVGEWWAGLPGCNPSPVPDAAREPVYSTWYSFHQQLSPDAVEAECRAAAAMGCKTVIMDDGWQTSDETRGYAYCGDWRVSADKIPDLKSHVTRIHELGMKFMLWYAVPFIGKHSQAWARFRDKLLYVSDELGAGVADPRYPEVREYLTAIYEQAVLEWDLDGFKLDFVDSFYAKGDIDLPADGQDTGSVPEAVDKLLSGIISRLRQLKPDILIEFRQNYIGPLMRKYGNMFRAGDCPNDALQNRIKTIDIRLICGSTAAHSDMLMWNPQESSAAAALQFINVLFSVPQISVRLDRLPEEHTAMLTFWLSFWREHRDVLLDGRLEPQHPELLYPLVTARTTRKWVIAAYHDTVIPITGNMPELVIIVNGTLLSRLVLELDCDTGPLDISVRDCQGTVTSEYQLNWNNGVHMLDVPAAGVITLEPASRKE